MKNLIGLSALVALVTMGTGSIAKAQEVQYDPSAARITEVDVYEETHNISLYTGSHGPLAFITLTPPDNSGITPNDVKVIQSGRTLNPTVYKDNGRILIVFDQLVPPRSNLEIALNDVDMERFGEPDIVNYRVSGGHVGLNQTLPYGLARVTLR